jgi:anaerobic selenocysteine-containing dehydrogenase
MFAAPTRGYCVAGVGPSFSSCSTLVNYLILDLETLCGHWMREGERVKRTVTLMPQMVYRAQAQSPSGNIRVGERLRVHDLVATPAGLPTGVLADEILLDGDGKVRALISCGGNPVAVWPDQLKTIEAMKDLDLLIQFDPWMSATARLASYVVAPTMAYEVPSMTLLMDNAIATHYYGPAEAYAHYTPAVVDPPDGSDVISEWQFFYRLAQRMGLTLEIVSPLSGRRTRLDMRVEPAADELLDALAVGSRVSLSEVKRHPHGGTFPEPASYVLPKEPGWTGKLDLANALMMTDLSALATGPDEPGSLAGDPHETYPFRLITRRTQHTYNSTSNFPETNRGRGYNPAFMHPDDLSALGLRSGDAALVTSRRASVKVVVEADGTLRRGLLSMTHGFGGAPDRDGEFRQIGAPTGRLLDNEEFADPYVGMPRIGNIPVSVSPAP